MIMSATGTSTAAAAVAAAAAAASSSLTGQLFVYGPNNRVAFESLLVVPSSSSSSSSSSSLSTSQQLLPRNKCILFGGLSDGLFPVPYTNALSNMICHFPYSGTERPLSESSSSESQLQSATLPPTSVSTLLFSKSSTTDSNDQQRQHQHHQQQQQQQTWSLIQPLLSSSYTGFGHGNLDRDVLELQELIDYLCEHRNAAISQDDAEEQEGGCISSNIVLVGHSTGCQQIIHYLRTYNSENQNGCTGSSKHQNRVTAVVLQAPVSDREAATIYHPKTSPYSSEEEHLQQLQYHIQLATSMTQKNLTTTTTTTAAPKSQYRGDEMMPRIAFWAPITASRYYDLMVKADDALDDYFSSDLTDLELQHRLSHISSSNNNNLRRVIVAYSGSDEYVPSHIDKHLLLHRLCQAMNYHCNEDKNTNMLKYDATTIITTTTDAKNTNHNNNENNRKIIAQSLYIENGNHNLSSSSSNDSMQLLQKIYDVLKELSFTPSHFSHE